MFFGAAESAAGVEPVLAAGEAEGVLLVLEVPDPVRLQANPPINMAVNAIRMVATDLVPFTNYPPNEPDFDRSGISKNVKR